MATEAGPRVRRCDSWAAAAEASINCCLKRLPVPGAGHDATGPRRPRTAAGGRPVISSRWPPYQGKGLREMVGLDESRRRGTVAGGDVSERLASGYGVEDTVHGQDRQLLPRQQAIRVAKAVGPLQGLDGDLGARRDAVERIAGHDAIRPDALEQGPNVSIRGRGARLRGSGLQDNVTQLRHPAVARERITPVGARGRRGRDRGRDIRRLAPGRAEHQGGNRQSCHRCVQVPTPHTHEVAISQTV